MTTNPIPLRDLTHPEFPAGSAKCVPNCGQCCEVIGLKAPRSAYDFILKHVAERSIDPDEWANAEWITTHFHEIDRELASRINPRRVALNVYASYYLCDVYDPFTKTCTDHKNRPPLCRNFPWAGLDPNDERVKGVLGPYSGCGWWRAYPTSEWPHWVDPLPPADFPTETEAQ